MPTYSIEINSSVTLQIKATDEEMAHEAAETLIDNLLTHESITNIDDISVSSCVDINNKEEDE